MAPRRERAFGLAALRAKKACTVELALALDWLEFPFVEPGPEEVQRDSAGGSHRDGVVEPKIDPARVVSAEVVVDRGYPAGRQLPQGAELIALYKVAEPAGIQAQVQQGRGGWVADDVVHLDHPPVDGSGEILDWREYEAQGEAIRCFGLQLRVPALQEVVLASRAEQRSAAIEGGSQSGPRALCGAGRWPARAARRRVGTAGISAHAEQAIPQGLEQLHDVRVTHRVLEAAAEAVIPDRRPFRTDPVGVGLLLGAVVGVPIAGADAQLIRARLSLDQRHARFGEILGYIEAASGAQCRPSLTGEVEGRERDVRFEDEPFLALLHPGEDSHAVLGKGYLHPVGAEVGRHRPSYDGLRRVTVLQPWRHQIVERPLGHPAQAPDVVRHAVRIGAIDERSAGRLARGRIGYDVHRLRHARFRKIVPVYARVQDLADLPVGVVVPVLGHLAL